MNKLAIQMPLTLKYRKDGDWFVGQLLEEPEVISQGATLKELQETIRDAYALMLSERKRKHSRRPSRISKSRHICVTA
jgi:predicted RNase H-like HicB family nuclease